MPDKKNHQEGRLVAALCNGTVIDHIPPAKVFQVVELLRLAQATTPITIGNNFASKQQGSKGMIKIADQFLPTEILNQIALIAPRVTLSIIRNYEVVEKKTVELPKELIGLVRCPNPKCITNNEPMRTRFTALDGEQEGIIRCAYCGRKIPHSKVELL